MMNYQETLSYLYHTLPMFQQKGQAAYHPGLENSIALESHLGNPYKKFHAVHVGGTNGKGSCSHTLAAILQSAGYRVGLYTSPHLLDFRERIRVNGEMMDQQFMIDFIEREKSFFEPLTPSFFEVTTALAFSYFAHMKIDVAVVEVGLGGRLDCTNVLSPDLGIITNISKDHTKILGDTLAEIATEKAGIIKENTPIIIGEANKETRPVFMRKAEEMHAPIVFAEDSSMLMNVTLCKEGGYEYTAISPFAPGAERTLIQDNPYLSQQAPYPITIQFHGELGGYCQPRNTETLLHALSALFQQGYQFDENHLKDGFAHVTELTHLHGRWERINISAPCPVYCDTGHNTGGMEYISQQLKNQECEQLHIVIGMVNDKDIKGVLTMLPQNAIYYFTQPSVERALAAEDIQQLGREAGLNGEKYPNVPEAVKAASMHARANDFIFVGGSSFIVADMLASLQDPK